MTCHMCCKNKPEWWCIDSTPSCWLRVVGPKVDEVEAGSMYPCCGTCRAEIEKTPKHAARVEWLEWSDHVAS